MKIKVIKTYNFDFTEERKRINRAFKKKNEVSTKKRLLDLIDTFASGNLSSAAKLYDSLPRNEERECSEKEFVDAQISDFFTDTIFGKFDTIQQIVNEKNKIVTPPKLNL